MQVPLPTRGLTLVVTSLSVDVKKKRRCERLGAMLCESRVDTKEAREQGAFHVIDLAEPQSRQARNDVARLLKASSKLRGFGLLSLSAAFPQRPPHSTAPPPP